MNTKKLMSIFIIAVLMFQFAALQPAVNALAKPKLLTTKKTLIVGESFKLKVKNKPKGAKITFASNKKAVATVNKKGNVKAKAAGKSVIMCKVKKAARTYKLKCKVTVKAPVSAPIKVTGVTLSVVQKDLYVGNSFTLTQMIAPANASNKAVSWQGSNAKVATVTHNGVVTAVAAGTCNITVKTNDGNKTATCAVTVKENPPTVVLGDKSIAFGNSVAVIKSILGEPNRIDPSIYGGEYYVYNSDYSKFIMVGIKDGVVVSFYTDASDFNFNGVTPQSGINEANTALGSSLSINKRVTHYAKDCTVQLFFDTHTSQKVVGVEVKEKSLVAGSYTEDVLRAIEKEIFDTTNSFRAKYSLAPFVWSDLAQVSSMKHSQDMAVNNYFSHTGLNGKSPFDRMHDEGITYMAAAENIAAGQRDAMGFTNAWYNSTSGHRDSVLSAVYTNLGVGSAYNAASTYGTYSTQNFFK